MTLKSWLAGLAGAVALGLVALPVEGAPASGLNTLQGSAAQTADVQQAHWYGRRHGYRHYHYGPRYGYRHHYRPGVRFYYGPRHRHHHRHYRW